MAQTQRNMIISPKKIRSFLSRKPVSSVPSPIEAKRSAIFNPELKELVEKVSTPPQSTTPSTVQPLPQATSSSSSLSQSTESLPSESSRVRTIVPPEKLQEQKLLSAIYIPAKNIQDSSIMEYTSYILERLGIEYFSWHFLAYDSNAYFSEMSSGIDIITRKSFLFLKTDPFIKRLTPNFFELRITNDLMRDPFFNKKFSVESLSLYSTIYFFFVDDLEVDACLVAFIEKSPSDVVGGHQPEEKVGSRWLEMVQEKIKIITPALKRYRVERLKPRISPDDMLTSTLHHFKAMIGEGMETFHVHKIKITNYADLPNAYFLKKQFISHILQNMGSREKIIELNLDSYLILMTQDYTSGIKSLAENDGIEVNILHKCYPDDGENYLSYL
ncbi:MAG: hypothetical protein JJT78_08980 [Leptospira sp.]|nr:hypothetical protein [Leptospira sp.]